LVLITECHRRAFNTVALDAPGDVLTTVRRAFEVNARGTEGDPAYLPLEYPPTVLVSLLVNSPKTPNQAVASASSRLAAALSISGLKAGAFRASW
jgi:hypothetical protein